MTQSNNFNSFSLISKSTKMAIYRYITKLIKKSGLTEKPPLTRVCRALSLSSSHLNNSLEFKFFKKHTPIQFDPPWLYSEVHTDFLKYFKGSSDTYSAGIISANNVFVSFPYPIHRWKGKVFIEYLKESTKYLSEPRYLMALEAIPFVKKKKMAEAVLLAMPAYENYFHWLVETMPRIKMIEDDKRLCHLPLILPKNRTPKFIRESLELAGYLDKTRFLDDGVYQFETLHIPTLFSKASNLSPLAIEWVREKLIRGNYLKRKRRIYISRKDALKRYVVNEAEVESILAQFGFETICLSNYSFKDQINFFQEAEIVIGSHGAGLTNLVFTPSESVLIELLREGPFNTCYYQLAGIRKIKYGFLICQRDGAGQYVDVNLLKELVEKAIQYV
jgi:hypothetical protein